MRANTPALAPGFADPVLDSQACFRALLDAMARPGTIHPIPAALHPPAPLGAAMAAAALTLLDLDTPFWLDDAAATPDALGWLRFHAGSPVVREPARAAFALIADPARALLPLDRFPLGEDAYPDRSATLIVQVAALEARGGFTLRGPGVEGSARVSVSGLPDGFAAAWDANRALFPRGIDLVLCAGSALACLPRTTALEG
ncbi:MAG: phosphonate C-P lyase system protein PhnH [Alphaproteobacteria bacterium]|nr:phosphonate C-P lyase system protein PhnH [Alphaproteobacteria bacterium]